MAFSIKNEEADVLLRELTAVTGETLTDAVIASLRERLARERRIRRPRGSDALHEAIARFRSLPVIDARPPDEILGYDEIGLPS